MTMQELCLPKQQKKVLSHLMKVGSISPREALLDHGIYRLSDVVLKLRRKGYNIKTELLVNPIDGHKYGRYFIDVPMVRT